MYSTWIGNQIQSDDTDIVWLLSELKKLLLVAKGAHVPMPHRWSCQYYLIRLD